MLESKGACRPKSVQDIVMVSPMKLPTPETIQYWPNVLPKKKGIGPWSII